MLWYVHVPRYVDVPLVHIQLEAGMCIYLGTHAGTHGSVEAVEAGTQYVYICYLDYLGHTERTMTLNQRLLQLP